MKAALLSGLVIPGLGQMALGHYRRGFLLMLAALAGLAAVVGIAVRRALAILGEIEAGGGRIDERMISEAASRALTAADSRMITGLFLLIAVCWVYALIDAYRLGKKKEKEDARP